MKVFLFLCLWTIPLFLHAQTTLQGTFIPVQELTSLEYRIQEERADMRYKISLSTSGVQAESYGSYQGERWGLSWKPRNFLGRSWNSSSLQIQGLRLSYLYDGEMSKAFHVQGRQGGFAYQLAERNTSRPSVYTWQGTNGKVFFFWDAESTHADLSLACTWAEEERLSLSHDISLSQGALSLDWKFSGNDQWQSRSVALDMKSHGIRAQWQMEIQAGPSPIFGGQRGEMEQSVRSKIRYSLGAITLESAMQSKVRTKISGVQTEKTSFQVTGKWKDYGINVEWDSLKGMSIELDTEKGNLCLSREGIAFSLLLKKGPLNLTIKKDTKEQLTLAYSFRFTIDPGSESPRAR